MVANILHLVGGAVGVWLGMKGNARTYNMALGIIAAVVGVLGLVPGAKDILADVFAFDMNFAILHIVIGAVALGIVYGLKK